MADRVLKVRIVGEHTNLNRAFDAVATRADRLGGRMSSAFATAGRAALGLGTAVAAIGGAGITGAYRLANAADDLAEAQSKANAVFGDSEAIIAAYADQAARTAGLSRTAATSAASSFGQLLKPTGLASDEMANMAAQLVGLSGDLASFNNISSEEAAAKLFSGLSGEAEPLREFAVFINAAAVEAKALELGLGGANGVLTDQEKILARYHLIMEQTTDTQGDFVRTSGSLANSQRTLAANWDNLQATLGEKLAPVMARVVGWVNDNLPGMVEWLGPRLEQAAAFASEAFERYWPKVSAAVQNAISIVGPILERVVSAVRDNWPQIAETATNVFGRLREIVVSGVEFLQAFWDRFGERITATISIAWDAISTAFELGSQIIVGLLDTATALLEGNWGEAWENIKGVMSSAWDLIKATASSALDVLVTWFGGLPGRAVDALGDLGGYLANAGRDLIQGLWDGAKEIFADFANWLIDKVNWAAGAVNWIPGVQLEVPTIGGGGASTSASRVRPNNSQLGVGQFGTFDPFAPTTANTSGNTVILNQTVTALDPEAAAAAAREAVRLNGTQTLQPFGVN